MEAETVLYFITVVVILTFIAFCYACYCTCREMKLKAGGSPSASTSSRVFWTGNSNTVMTLHPASFRRQATQRFRQMSWRSLMQRNANNRSPTPSTGSAYPLISMHRPSFDVGHPGGGSNFITVVYERNSNRISAVPTSPLTVQTLAIPHTTPMSINIPNNCLLHSSPRTSIYMPQHDLPPPSYDDAIRSSTILMTSETEEKEQTSLK